MIAELLKKLVSFKTVTGDQAENRRAFSWIAEQIAALPVFSEMLEFDGFPAMVITTRKTKSPKLWLVAHMDVVPASDRMFSPQVVDGKLYGRGVFDMKFAIASYIRLLLDLNKQVTKHDFGILLVSDEETGGFHGAKKLVEANYRADCILLPDGGENWVLQEAAKGVSSVQFTSKGTAAHSARPWLGKNAIETLMDFLSVLRKEFVVEPCGDPDHFHTTLNIGTIRGGTVSNQVPDTAEAKVDIRFVPDTDTKELEKRIMALLKAFPGIEMEIKTTGISYSVDKTNPYFTLFLIVLKKNLIKPGYLKSHGSSDARFFIEKGIPTILIRPLGGNLHSEQEWIDLKSLELFYNVLKEFVLQATK